MKLRQNKILLIDWFNTLSYSKFWGHLEKSDKEKFDLIENYLFGKNGKLVRSWMRGNYTSEQIVKIVADDLKLSYNKTLKDFIKSCQNMEFSSNKITGMVRKIRKSGSKVYIFSDNMDSLDRWTAPSLKLNTLFDGIINSFNLGFLKTDSTIKGKNLFLKTVVKKENASPKDLVLLDDGEKTINLYRNFGVKSVQIYKENTLEKELVKFV